MRLKISKSKNTNIYYVIQTIYVDGKEKTKTFERLGNESEVRKKAKGEDPVIWAKKYIETLNAQEQERKLPVLMKKYPSKIIDKNVQNTFNCGYFFLEKLYYALGLNIICQMITSKYKFEYNLDEILSKLIYSRIIYPSSKLATYKLSQKFVEQPSFELQQIYRALEIIAKESDFIQSELYKNSLKYSKRNTGVLYYDCTNYFFEIEQQDGLKQYGASKEHRPNPITQMGLFMDGDGIPLAFNISSGNTNEQKTLTPTEKKILKDFKISKFIVCTDAGLSSMENRKFNDCNDRAFVTTQSIKKLKKFLKEWALSPDGWQLPNDTNFFNINEIEKNEELLEKHKNNIFFKERWINENGLEQKLIVTFSFKYKHYQREIRNSQIERATKAIEDTSFKIDTKNQNDFRRFIKKTTVTQDGEIASKKIFSLNSETIQNEEQYDGFYGICTNLDDEPETIIKVNQRRWEIEECFRIMKSEFKARPVYLSRDDRISAHFTVCFLSLVLHRYLEKSLDEKFTAYEIIETLRNMNLVKDPYGNYIPAYTRSDLTDCLHETFKFRTDYEVTQNKEIKKILKQIKK